jgi:hypothetical protein
MPPALVGLNCRYGGRAARTSPQSYEPDRIYNSIARGFAMSKPMFSFTGVYDTVVQAKQR